MRKSKLAALGAMLARSQTPSGLLVCSDPDMLATAKPGPFPVIFTIPIRTVSTSNVREHWATRAKRTGRERAAIAWMGVAKCALVVLPVTVTLTRIAPRELDDDNLRGCLKSCRDSVADCLGLPNDRDPRATWTYSQERGKPKEYAVRVTIEARP
jgi:hypothetical protein